MSEDTRRARPDNIDTSPAEKEALVALPDAQESNAVRMTGPATIEGWKLVPEQRLKNARALVVRGMWTEGCRILDELVDAAAPCFPDYVTARQAKELQAEVERLNAIINTPQANDFLRAVSIEAEHQRQRWGDTADAGKTPADWFWLVGYLAGKALHSHAAGNVDKAEHHIITTAAACANWHLAMFGKTNMRPGHEHGVKPCA